MEEDFSFLPEANPESIDADSIITFQNGHGDSDYDQTMVDISLPGVPYKGISQTYITQSSRYIDEDDPSIQKKKPNNKKKVDKFFKYENKNKDNNSQNISSSNFFNYTKENDVYNDYDICPTTPVEIQEANTLNPIPQDNPNISNNEDIKRNYIKQFDISNPSHIYSSLSIENDEKLKKEINDNLRVQRIKERRQKEEEARYHQLEEEENKIKTRLSMLQQQKLQKIVQNHEEFRAKSQKALKQRQIIEEMKQKTAESAILRIETAEKRKIQIQKAQQEHAMQKAADEWLKRHFAKQAILQMERRKERQLRILAQKEKESTLRVQKMKSDMMKKEQTRRSVMKKFYASCPAKI